MRVCVHVHVSTGCVHATVQCHTKLSESTDRMDLNPNDGVAPDTEDDLDVSGLYVHNYS